MKKKKSNPSQPAIGREEIEAAGQLLLKYKRDKANLEAKIVANEQWWKMRHWEQLRTGDDCPRAASAWLWNVIVSKHADAMDTYPEPNLLPRYADDINEARRLSSVVPVILDQNDFERVYSELQWYKLKQGTGVYGVFWDRSMHNGLGDISINKVDLLSLFWESGVSCIQDSPNLFYVRLCNTRELLRTYPQLEDRVGNDRIEIAKYQFDDNVDTTDKTPCVDWYYHRVKDGKRILHYCKFVGDTLLFATENMPDKYPHGWYDHGMYPFIFDPLFTIEGTPCGYGYIDIGKEAQAQIDILNQAIINNAVLAAKPRFFIRGEGSVNEEEFADWTKDFVHTNGTLGEDSIRQISVDPLSGIYLNILGSKIDELKETSGNRDTSNGGTAAGVTAASAIAAMQEAGSKLSRDSTRGSYAAYRQVISMCVELIRQFYDLPRCFRIIGDLGKPEFTSYSNRGLRPIHQGYEYGVDMGYRTPAFDIEISAQKSNPYSKISQNELALQFYNLGFFDPQNADKAIACLEMMDFARKESVMQHIMAARGMS